MDIITILIGIGVLVLVAVVVLVVGGKKNKTTLQLIRDRKQYFQQQLLAKDFDKTLSNPQFGSRLKTIIDDLYESLGEELPKTAQEDKITESNDQDLIDKLVQWVAASYYPTVLSSEGARIAILAYKDTMRVYPELSRSAPN